MAWRTAGPSARSHSPCSSIGIGAPCSRTTIFRACRSFRGTGSRLAVNCASTRVTSAPGRHRGFLDEAFGRRRGSPGRRDLARLTGILNSSAPQASSGPVRSSGVQRCRAVRSDPVGWGPASLRSRQIRRQPGQGAGNLCLPSSLQLAVFAGVLFRLSALVDPSTAETETGLTCPHLSCRVAP